LILDDFGNEAWINSTIDLMEIIEDRHGRLATVIASQLPVAQAGMMSSVKLLC